jgi:GNAT superfamily N-acetyltransferase
MKLFGKPERQPAKLDLSKIEVTRLNKAHVVNRFDCGRNPLDRFIKSKTARKSEARLEYRVFVALLEGSLECIGYYALQLGSDAVPKTKTEQQSYLQNHSAFPAVHLGYLAFHRPFQRQGLGRYLLMNAFEHVAAIADHAGFYALTLQSIDDESTRFYESIGFRAYTTGGDQPKMLYPIQSILELTNSSE